MSTTKTTTTKRHWTNCKVCRRSVRVGDTCECMSRYPLCVDDLQEGRKYIDEDEEAMRVSHRPKGSRDVVAHVTHHDSVFHYLARSEWRFRPWEPGC